jgi:hypothetical protein
MAFIKVQLKPGVNRDQTNYTGEGGWFDSEKIRFFSGYPQKLGGWLKLLAGATVGTSSYILGTCRQMWNWVTTFSDDFMALGTNEKVYIEVGTNLFDITPLRAVDPTTSAGDVTFSATNGSSTITVSDTGSNAVVDNYVTFSGAVTLGGDITAAVLNQSYKIDTVINANSYTVLAKSATTGDEVLATAADASRLVFTVNTGTEFITFSSFTPIDGNTLYVYSTGTLPSPLAVDTRYFIISSAGLTCQLSATLAGPAIDLTTAGTGTLSAQGGDVIGQYDINTGFSGGTYGYGFGVGTWGRGTWGSGTAVPIVFPQRDWWFDNFDNDLVMNIREGAPYYWERGTDSNPTTALGTRAITLQAYAVTQSFLAADVPIKVGQLLISQNDKHLLALGAVPYGSTDPDDYDPLLIRWASQDSPGEWAPATDNSAGDIRVSRGSFIVTGLASRQEILVWTDSSLYALTFLGTTDVFSLQEYADNTSIISPRAKTVSNNVVYWMGIDKFYAYAGRLETLPCTIRNYVYNDLNYEQVDQIISGTNEGFNEVWWFYPSSTSNTNDRYVIYNHLEKIWMYGTMERTAWIDSSLRLKPQAIDTDFTTQIGAMYNHETGLNDDTSAMVSYIQSNDVDLGDGDKFILTKRIIPDIGFDTSTAAAPSVEFQLRSRNFPGSAFNTATDAQDTKNVISTTVDTFTEQVYVRVRARQVALKVGSTDLGVQWQLGSPRVDGREDGER